MMWASFACHILSAQEYNRLKHVVEAIAKRSNFWLWLWSVQCRDFQLYSGQASCSPVERWTVRRERFVVLEAMSWSKEATKENFGELFPSASADGTVQRWKRHVSDLSVNARLLPQPHVHQPLLGKQRAFSRAIEEAACQEYAQRSSLQPIVTATRAPV